MFDIDDIIKVNEYVGIRTRRGQSILELTVRVNHSPYMAAQILLRMQDSDYA